MALATRAYISAVLICLLALGLSSDHTSPSAEAIGLANIIATSVYWGSNPLAPSNAHPGDTNIQLSIVLSNVGDDMARNVNATLLLGPPLTYTYYINDKQYSAASVSKIAGDMPPGSIFTLGFTVSVDSNAKEGVYRYQLQISYRTARELQEVASSTAIDVPIWKGELRIQNILTIPTKIYPGSKQVQVKVLIANSGKGIAKDLQLRMQMQTPFEASSSGSDIYFLGSLPAEQVSEVNFIVDVDENADFGRYFVALGLESGEKLIPIGEVPISINEKVKFEVVSVTPTSFQAGDSGKVIRVELKNAGSIKADSVRVQLRVGNFFTGTLTDFLGTMYAGEVKVAFFTVDIDAKAQTREYGFDLKIDWTQDSAALDETLRVTFNVQPPGGPPTLLIFGVVVVIVVAGYVVIRWRRKRAVRPPTK